VEGYGKVNDLEAKNILLTGASRGLGAQVARAAWRRGASLLLTARSETALAQLRAELLSVARPGQTAEIFKADLANPQAPQLILSRARSVWDRVDVLINNAALPGPIGKAWENPWDEWQMTLQVNLLAPVALCRAVVLRMVEAGQGKIINLSGGGAATPRPYFSAYAAAKAALVRFSETLAQEVRDFNIQVNCVAPGVMNTDMLQAVCRAGPEKAGASEYARALEYARQETSSPERAAELCCYLSSSASQGITGKLISAVWDPWESLESHLEDLKETDLYTLRRIVPGDRGLKWE
jgi:NAD(P)-dependent dehydrogenase (short-subunit alcohol dehydrogenase family)